jgi:hypothetical protein
MAHQKPIFIELTKTAANDFAAHAPADPLAHMPGAQTSGSLPISYTIKGWLRGEPTVGAPLVVDRTERNSIPARGLFVSTAVVAFDDSRIQTVNSVYRWRRCEPSEPPGARGPSRSPDKSPQ